jgi:hypothetical protein
VDTAVARTTPKWVIGFGIDDATPNRITGVRRPGVT